MFSVFNQNKTFVVMIDFSFLRQIRHFELNKAKAHFPQGANLLELGAGAGWQAKQLSDQGFSVSAIDIPSTEYLVHQEFPVLPYDGEHIPFPDAHFDVVFSSNVMEHVADLSGMHAEIQRVLKPGGLVLHILPTTSWRFWTSMVHPLGVLRDNHLYSRSTLIRRPGLVLRTLLRHFWPELHGERGNIITELYFFSSAFWHKNFARHGFVVKESQPVGIFYTGYLLRAGSWSISYRQALAKKLGSSCRLYLLQKADTPPPTPKP
jgi:SAM-dependent methyltransferase